ncbi:MAG: hypothetical protein RBT33_03105 [Candidatus Dojkabacteria bacterium]|jgi:hypothetical protein|nr:hypothetical protein [Candidatus Dojkabacteria bacterium]
MFLASSTPSSVTFIKADMTGRDVENVLTRWAGGIGVDPEPVMYASWKAYTLLAKGELKGISKTPLPNFIHGCPYAGGLRDQRYITSCSGWQNDKVDLMLAALFMYSLSEEVRFHHAGFSYQSENACINGMKRSLANSNSSPIARHFNQTKRWYVEIETRFSPNGKFWIEHQCLPEDPTISLHWDVATSDPQGLIGYISKQVEIQGKYLRKRPDSPSAKITIVDTDGTEISIMARSNWSEIEDW